jgi:acetyl-CoA carboxylase biotin carboxyl carrier protein
MTIEEIKELLQLFNASGVGELEVERDDFRIRISRAASSQEHVVSVSPSAAAPLAAGHITASQAAHAAPMAASGAAPAPQPEADADQVLVKSPIVGTFYETPSPGAPPFVKVGDSVAPGQVLCIIESMKLMNEIEAEVAGTLIAKLVENGRPVEYGEALFSIRPA